MKTDKKGCSTCPRGQEQYEEYTDYRGNQLVQYDYRDTDGELFSCVKQTLEECRKKRDRWLQEKKQAIMKTIDQSAFGFYGPPPSKMVK